MANEIRIYGELLYTPDSTSTEVTILARNVSINPELEKVMLTQLDKDNHMIIDAGSEVINGKLSYELSEIDEFPKELIDIMHGSNSGHVPGMTVSKGTATLNIHDRNDAANTPFYTHIGFHCEVDVNFDGNISDFSKASVTVTMLGTNKGTYKVRGTPV